MVGDDLKQEGIVHLEQGASEAPLQPCEASHDSEAWNKFYAKHSNGMYQDRHWLWAVFPELFPIPPHVDPRAIDAFQCRKFVCHCGHTSNVADIVLNHAETRNKAVAVPHSLKCGACGYNPLHMSRFSLGRGDEDSLRGPSAAQPETKSRYKYIIAPFPQRHPPPQRKQLLTVADLGCGVGNTCFPLLEKNDQVAVFASDYSRASVTILRRRERFDEALLRTGIHDITCPLPKELHGTFDYATLLFVLSAVPSEALIRSALGNSLQLLKEGGVLLIYDYGAGDYRETKFGARSAAVSTSTLGSCYKRDGDDTFALFFREDGLRGLCSALPGAALEELAIRAKEEHNRKTGARWSKRYILAKLRKDSKI